LSWKIIILIVLVLFSCLMNYKKISDGFLGIFPVSGKISVAFLSLSKNSEQNFFQSDKIWGWPFGYWENQQFDFKFLVFDLVFCIIVWLIIIFFIWFFVGMKKLKERRLKPPKFDL